MGKHSELRKHTHTHTRIHISMERQVCDYHPATMAEMVMMQQYMSGHGHHHHHHLPHQSRWGALPEHQTGFALDPYGPTGDCGPPPLPPPPQSSFKPNPSAYSHPPYPQPPEAALPPFSSEQYGPNLQQQHPANTTDPQKAQNVDSLHKHLTENSRE